MSVLLFFIIVFNLLAIASLCIGWDSEEAPQCAFAVIFGIVLLLIWFFVQWVMR